MASHDLSSGSKTQQINNSNVSGDGDIVPSMNNTSTSSNNSLKQLSDADVTTSTVDDLAPQNTVDETRVHLVEGEILRGEITALMDRIDSVALDEIRNAEPNADARDTNNTNESDDAGDSNIVDNANNTDDSDLANVSAEASPELAINQDGGPSERELQNLPVSASNGEQSSFNLQKPNGKPTPRSYAMNADVSRKR